MNLRAQILAFAAPHGIRVAALYDMLRSLGRERVDYALLGLIHSGELVRVGDVVARPAHALSVACSRCHESRRRDELIQRDEARFAGTAIGTAVLLVVLVLLILALSTP